MVIAEGAAIIPSTCLIDVAADCLYLCPTIGIGGKHGVDVGHHLIDLDELSGYIDARLDHPIHLDFHAAKIEGIHVTGEQVSHVSADTLGFSPFFLFSHDKIDLSFMRSDDFVHVQRDDAKGIGSARACFHTKGIDLAVMVGVRQCVHRGGPPPP